MLDITQKVLNKKKELNDTTNELIKLADELLGKFSHPDFNININGDPNINNISFYASVRQFYLKVYIKINRKDKDMEIRYRTEEDSIFNADFRKYTNMCNKVESVISDMGYQEFYIFFEQYLKLTKEKNKLKRELSKLELEKKVFDNQKLLSDIEGCFQHKDIIQADKDKFNKNTDYSLGLLYFDYEPETDSLGFKKETLIKKNKVFYILTEGIFREEEVKITKKRAMQILERQVFVKENKILELDKIPFLKGIEKSREYRQSIFISLSNLKPFTDKLFVSLKFKKF